MGFASEGVNMVGGTAPVGQGRAADYAADTQIMGTEPPRGGLQPKGIQPWGFARPILQVPVVQHKFQKMHEQAPGLSSFFGPWKHTALTILNFLAAPQPTRKDNKPTEDERRVMLAGSPGIDGHGGSPQPDLETRGLMLEPVARIGVGSPMSGISTPSNDPVHGQRSRVKDLIGGDDVDPQDITNTPPGGMTDDVARLTQNWCTNEHDYLTAFRSSFPAASVNQAPAAARNIILKQNGGTGAFLGEMNIPDGAVTARFTWTTTAGVAIDLFWSLTGQAFIPVGTNQPAAGITQADIANDTLMLNPDPTTRYLVKGKRAVSFATSVACTVHGEFYMQA